MVDIQSGSWSAVIDAQRGQLLALRNAGADLLRGAPQLRATASGAEQSEVAATDAAAFVMAPFAGRIAQGAFTWRGQRIQLALGTDEPHAIHGHAWQLPWSTLAAGPDSMILGVSWSGSGSQSHWPWAYRLEQHLALAPSGLTVRLTLTNCSADEMPAGLGWHPYFVRDDAHLSLSASHRWEVDAQVLPTRRQGLGADTPLRRGEPMAGTTYDNPLQLDDGAAELHWPARGRRLLLRWSHPGTARFAVVFNHPDENCFCVEPVTHVPNMVNLSTASEHTGLLALPPGASLTLECAILLAD